MKHIAVMIRGHLRTWNYNKQVIFDFYDSIADNVDYYFATWGMYDPAVISSVQQDFAGKNLIKLLTVPVVSDIYNGWTGPGLFSYLLIPYKRQREKKVKYDAVFDMRPDVIIGLRDQNIICPEPKTLYTTHFNNQREILIDPSSKFCIGLADHFFVTTSEVYDIMSHRYIIFAIEGPHIAIQRICEAEGINACTISWINVEMTRPNCFDDVPDSRKYIGSERRDWIVLSSEEKIQLLNRHGIKIEDYMTDSMTCSI